MIPPAGFMPGRAGVQGLWRRKGRTFADGHRVARARFPYSEGPGVGSSSQGHGAGGVSPPSSGPWVCGTEPGGLPLSWLD